MKIVKAIGVRVSTMPMGMKPTMKIVMAQSEEHLAIPVKVK